MNQCLAAAATLIKQSLSPAELAQAGPFAFSRVEGRIAISRAQLDGSTKHTTLPLIATLPSGAAKEHGSSCAWGPPHPVCVLFNGFQGRASQYRQIAERLASWGFITLQYNAPALTIIHDAHELPFMRTAVDWLRQKSGEEGSALSGRVDLARVCVAGHSRGAKLAALQFAADPGIAAAYLLDPVDCTIHTPEGPTYPSAARALKKAGRPIGITGAGVMGAANPEGSNWRHFFAAAAPGSRLQVLPRAGHTNFMVSVSRVEQWLLDRCFGGGPASRQDVLNQIMPPMLTWFAQQLAQHAPAGPGKQEQLTRAEAFEGAFRQWLGPLQSSQEMLFEEKPGTQAASKQQQQQQQQEVREVAGAGARQK